MLRLEFTVEGWSDYLYWQEHDIRQLKRLNKLIQGKRPANYILREIVL